MQSVELFAGAGGLALGVSMAGFNHKAVVEFDRHACETIRQNQRRGVWPVSGWPLFEADVRTFDYSSVSGEIDLLSGGPPCQPFSLGGQHRAYNDSRDMFPEVVRATRKLQPCVVMFENVRGLIRQSFAKYFEYVLLQITYPEIVAYPDEEWSAHLARLEQYHTRGSHDGLFYRVIFTVLNAADYGIPQKRERVFIVGFRCDLDLDWSFPQPTHSQEALLWTQLISGEYWERHSLPKSERLWFEKHHDSKLINLRSRLFAPDTLPWLTVRDAICDLPDPEAYGYLGTVPDHKFNPGARIYKGHTGSPLDEPAKTLKAGDHGVPGGENIVVFPDGHVRYFTVRESARLQTFPDSYAFSGSWTESMRQIGNAVPVTLAKIIATSIQVRLRSSLKSVNS